MRYNEEHSIERFVTAQAQPHSGYVDALAEMRTGNLDAMRDWCYAKVYVRAMYLML